MRPQIWTLKNILILIPPGLNCYTCDTDASPDCEEKPEGLTTATCLDGKDYCYISRRIDKTEGGLGGICQILRRLNQEFRDLFFRCDPRARVLFGKRGKPCVSNRRC